MNDKLEVGSHTYISDWAVPECTLEVELDAIWYVEMDLHVIYDSQIVAVQQKRTVMYFEKKRGVYIFQEY